MVWIGLLAESFEQLLPGSMVMFPVQALAEQHSCTSACMCQAMTVWLPMRRICPASSLHSRDSPPGVVLLLS